MKKSEEGTNLKDTAARAARIRQLGAYKWLKPAEEQELARLRSQRS